jgi:pimeloyl-ACP methyl ester carboxylesterase
MTQPVWVVVGEDDTVFTVEDSQEIQRHVPGSKLITVPGANHIIVVNNPEVVERMILDFIADCGVFAGEQEPAGS